MAAHGGAHSIRDRLRSASPANRRSLAIDMRRIAGLLRDSPAPAALVADNSMNNSMCSSPHSAWEPNERPAIAVGSAGPSPVAASRMVMNNQVAAMAEKLNQIVRGLQQQCEGDRRRLNTLERKLEAGVEDRARHGEQRERWAELQGKVDGLIEETQSLTRRVEGLDERLWARTSGSEGAKQRSRELEQQVQALEQQTRMATATAEETTKRQTAKLRRAEHAAEEAIRRLAKLEDDIRGRLGAPRDGMLEARVNAVEQQQEQLDDLVRTIQAQLDEGLQGLGDVGAGDAEGGSIMVGELGREAEEAARAAERGLTDLEKKVMKQVEEQAAFRVKVEHQLSRVGTLADRLETAHAPALESLRAEMANQRAQDRQQLEGEVAALRRRIQESTDNAEEALTEVRESLRHSQAEAVVASGLRPDDSAAFRNLSDQLLALEQRLEAVEEMPLGAGDPGQFATGDEDRVPEDGGGMHEQELEDIRSRLEWLEEQGAARAAEAPQARQAAEAQEKMCKVLERLSCLEQQASRGEIDKLHQQFQLLQDSLERRQAEDSSCARSSVETDAKVGAVSKEVAQLAARLSEVEGSLDFARDAGEAPGARPADSGASEVGGGRPPLPRGDVERDRESGSHMAGLQEIQERLVDVAAHLEMVDELSDRVSRLEGRPPMGEEQHWTKGESPAKAHSEVSFGGDAPIKGLGVSLVDELHAELQALKRDALSLKEEAARRELVDEQLKANMTRRDNNIKDLTDKMDALEQLPSEVGALAEQVSELQTSGASPGGAAGQEDLEAIKERLEELEALTSKASGAPPGTAAGQEEVDDIKERLDKLEALTSKDDVEGVKEKLTELEELISKAAKDAKVQADMSELRGRVNDLTAQVSVMRIADGGSPKREPLAQVQASVGELRDKVSELTAQVSDLRSASEQTASPKETSSELQADLKELRDKVDELATHVSTLRSGEPSSPKESSSELQAELDDLRGRLEQFEEELGDVEAVKNEVSQVQELASKLSSVEEEVVRLTAEPWKEALEEQKNSLQELNTKLTGMEGGKALGGLHESLQQHHKDLEAVKAQVDGLEKQVNVSAAAKTAQVSPAVVDELKAADDALKAEVESQSSKLSGEVDSLSKRLDNLEGAQSPEGDMDKLSRRLDKLEEGAQSPKAAPGASSLEVDRLSGQVKSALERLDGMSERLEKAEQSASEAAQATQSAPAGGGDGPKVEGLSQQVADVADRLDKLEGRVADAEGKDVKMDAKEAAAEVEAKLAAKIKALEEQLEARPQGGGDAGGASAGGASSTDAAEDRAREDVQEQMSALTAQLAKELASLAGHQEELQSVKAAIENGGGGAQAGGGADTAALDSIGEKVAESCKRALAAEDAVNAVRREIEAIRGSSPKVGISAGGSSAGDDGVRARLDELDKQVGQLQLQLKGKVLSPPSAARGDEPLDFSLTGASEHMRAASNLGRGDEPLDFSLTGASEQMRAASNLGEEPLDFSLTGMTDRPGGGLGDSLNLSLTEASRGGASFSEPPRDSGDAGGGARGVGLGGAGNAAAGSGGRSRPSPLKLEEQDKSMPLSPVAEGSVSEERRKAAASSKSESKEADQPQDSLSALMAGGSESARRSSPAGSPRESCVRVQSPTKSPAGSDHLAASMQSNLGESVMSQVSQSGNEMSVGADYSVEDSTELEKCDYYEAVEPSSAHESPSGSGGNNPGDALDGILGGGRPRPSQLQPMATPQAEAPKSSASVDTVIHRTPEASAGVGTNAAPQEREGGGDEYGDESFDEEDMSIPESIGSQEDGSNSDEV